MFAWRPVATSCQCQARRLIPVVVAPARIRRAHGAALGGQKEWPTTRGGEAAHALNRFEAMRFFSSSSTDKSSPAASNSAAAPADETTITDAGSSSTVESAAESMARVAQQQPITAATLKTQRKVLFPRAEEEDGEERDVEDPDEEREPGEDEGEYGFKYKGLEPTAYGDWSHKGRVTDF